MKHPIPKAALDNHIAILGKTGSGKTYAAKGIVEGLLAGKERVVIIDPTSAYWGLRSSSNGKGDGFPIVVFGGPKADVPLDKSHGELIAEIVGTSNTPAIIDTRELSVGDRTRFFADFAEALLRKNQGSLHVVIDEAHLFAPQGRVNDPQSGKMLHAANNLVSLGRGIGLKIIMITQRPAKLHKDSLTQVETLIAMRLVAPQDRDAVQDWIGEWADPKEGKTLLQELPSLPSGEGWIWSPLANVLKRAQFPRIKTFDSSAAGQNGKAPSMATIDVPVLQERLKAVVKETEENDPKKLKARIHELERLKKPIGIDPDVSKQQINQAYKDGYETGKQHGAAEGWSRAIKTLSDVVKGLKPVYEKPEFPFRSMDHAGKVTIHKVEKTKEPVDLKGYTSVMHVHKPDPRTSSLGLSKAEKTFLTVMAQQKKPMTRNKVAIFAGYSVKSGHIDNTLGGLRSKGYVQGGNDAVQITQAGLDTLGDFAELPTGEELRRYWVNKMDKAGAMFLNVLFDIYPNSIHRNDLAERCGYSPASGHVDNTLGKLRSFELATGKNDAITASADLF